MADASVGRERLGLLIVLAGIGFVILCALGIWQLQRLSWKQDLLARVEDRTGQPPVPVPDPEAWPSLDYDDVDYLPVVVTGQFIHADEVHAYSALPDPVGPLGGQGYFIVTPLETDDGWIVLVNRGFVPEQFKDPSTRAAGQLTGPVEITGLLRPPQGRNAFTPTDDPEANVWFTRDPHAIGEALGYEPDRLAPYYIDATFDEGLVGGVPQGGETQVSFSNNHLQYVVTWFGLAAALLVITIIRVRSTRRRRRTVTGE